MTRTDGDERAITLLLVRHGESVGNVERRLQGPDDPLTERGRRQAADLATYLAGRGDVVTVYTSPLARATATAQCIGRALAIEPVERSRLAEIDVGCASGLRFDDWEERFPEHAARFHEDGVSFEWPGGESGLEFGERVLREIDDVLASRPASGSVVVVSHGGALAWVIEYLRGESNGDWPSRYMGLANASITEVRFDPGGSVSFISHNEVGHLSPDPDDEVAVGESG